ncbi:MAG: hypothetical protein QM759_13230 [Terricaulis sp.]
MKTLSCLVLLSLVGVSIPSGAQQSSVWTDPSGRFTLSFAELGWSGPQQPETEDGYILAVENLELSRGRAVPDVCAVRHAPPARNFPADRINAMTDGLSESVLQRFHHTQAPIQNLMRLEIDGVHVVDYVTEMNGAWQHWRTFWLEQSNDAVMYDVACTGTSPVSSDEMTNMAAVLGSLHFVPARTK